MIVVVVKSKDINFQPKNGDFLKIKGHLQDASPYAGGVERIMVWADSASKVSPPVDW